MCSFRGARRERHGQHWDRRSVSSEFHVGNECGRARDTSLKKNQLTGTNAMVRGFSARECWR